MVQLDMSVIYFALMTFTLFQPIARVSSIEVCNANIFYDFMYCLSSISQCGQCIPCYNNASLYIPTGNDNAMSCTASSICSACATHCASNFNSDQYRIKFIQNVASSDEDTACPLLKSIVSSINSHTLSNVNNATQYYHECATDHVLSIKYAMMTSTNHYDNYTQDDPSNCTVDFSLALTRSCDHQKRFCQFPLHPFIPRHCTTDNGYTAVIGSFCVSTKTPHYVPGQHFMPPEPANSIPYSDAVIWTLIILPWAILCLTALVAIIFCLTRLNACSIQCMPCKKVSDPKHSKLNKAPRQNAERINSDTILQNSGDESNKNKRIMISSPSGGNTVHPRPHSHSHPSVVSSAPHPQSSHMNKHNKGRNLEAQHSASGHKYRSQSTTSSHRSGLGGARGSNRNKYQHMRNRSKAKHAPAIPQDTMVVQFPPRRPAVAAATDLYNPAIPITGAHGHGRNSSVIMNGVPVAELATRDSSKDSVTGGWPGVNHTQRSVHPMAGLNHSSLVNDTMVQSSAAYNNGLDELAHSLIYPNLNAPNFEQKQEYYNTYWNQYYGVSPQTQQANAEFHDRNNFDFANPNGDATMNVGPFDDSKTLMVGQNEIALEAEIGRGSSSKVFKARWRNTEVAAKRFASTFGIDLKKAQQYADDYVSKVNKDPHANVIKILAFAHKPFTMVTEYMNKGSVKNHVRRSRPGSTSISILDRILIAFQAAKGLQHLHKLDIIHSEINCQNLLMEIVNLDGEESIRVVVTDYALQNILSGDELETYRSSLGPLKWMAPECIENGSSPSTKESDIYAFGITMWEIITGQEPYPDVDPVDTAIHVLVKERRPQSYAFIPEKIQNLMKICWHKHPKKRPDADKIVQILDQFITTERKQNAERHDLL
eukprot:207879_1